MDIDKEVFLTGASGFVGGAVAKNFNFKKLMNYNLILLSSEFFNLLKLSLCVNRMIIKVINRKKLSE